ncbi:uncharacterized protein LOC110114389 [Dendrobium catenatum]|uniref:uncharacterized protein LOC110114389 n=1 Tax=Dendrobium catenatum TaxID=906689 RepID=UPI00109F5EC3|nr:uncharacterized protein LOC110114389 [Dendrobium catenatum]
MAWSRGVWFFLGKPFVLQKWHPKFKPKKEEFSAVPIWVKIHDLPLACWNSEGISRIASKVGIPVAADKLTEQKTRLTFARICVLVDNLATYPEEIQVSLDGDVVSLKVQYEWRPTPCEHCKSLMHASSFCPTKPKLASEELANANDNAGIRGRSYSRKPRNRHNSKSQNISRPPITPIVQQNSEQITTKTQSASQPAVNITNAIGKTLSFQPHSPTSQNIPPNNMSVVEDLPITDSLPPVDAIVLGIPNLNSPQEAISSSSTTHNSVPAKDFISPNKFDALSIEEEQTLQSDDNVSLDSKLDTGAGGKSKAMEKANKPLLQLSAIYASNNHMERKELWDTLVTIIVVVLLMKNLGGTALNQSALIDLNNMIFSNSLVDLNSVGLKYTWFNQRTTNLIHIKLDSVLVNEGWLNFFPESYCAVQSPSCSDHCPLILNPGMNIQVHHRFLFKNYWTNIDKYWAILLDFFSKPCNGNPISHLRNTLNLIKDAVKSERAKVNWIRQGEDDLKFLFAKIRIRRGSSKSVFNLLANSPSSSRADVVSSLIHYFQGLYNPPTPPNATLNCIPSGIKLSQADAIRITSYVLDDEIKHAVFSGNTNSAPGPDGYNFYFYKSAWHIVGPLVCRAVHSFFQKCYLPHGVKATALAIIPKHKNASELSDYRHIALCNVLYKIIAKVLAERLKPVMNHIVMDNQAGFLKSRVSTDNILFANDILSYAGKSKDSNYFCAKLDIRKAFDSVSRDFLLSRLVQKGFPPLFVNWIKLCIKDVSFSILLNGAIEGYFSTSAGLRQGCPLSPYLFCLVMDAFSNLLENRGFKGISYENYALSHLLYADDVLIFGEAFVDNCNNLANILRDFTLSTRLHINYEKSAIMIPKNQRNVQDICQILSIHNIVNKITYLGIPLSFYRLKIEDFLPLVDSLNKKMNGWKANLLSLAGRLQYIKFTIQNTIAYWIRGSILPKTVLKYINRTSSKFLFFGDSNAAKKLHMDV